MSVQRIPARRRTCDIIRSGGLILLPVALIGSAFGWISTWRTLALAEYRFGSFLAPGSSGGDASMWVYRARTVGITSFHGSIALRFSEYRSLAPVRDELKGWNDHAGWQFQTHSGVSARPAPLVRWSNIADFELLGLGMTQGSRQGEDSRIVSIPYWFLAMASVGAWLLLYFPHRRRRRRSARNACPSCGYSREGLADADPCPECGGVKPAAR